MCVLTACWRGVLNWPSSCSSSLGSGVWIHISSIFSSWMWVLIDLVCPSCLFSNHSIPPFPRSHSDLFSLSRVCTLLLTLCHHYLSTISLSSLACRLLCLNRPHIPLFFDFFVKSSLLWFSYFSFAQFHVSIKSYLLLLTSFFSTLNCVIQVDLSQKRHMATLCYVKK